MQGERTDAKVVQAISGALANKSACKVQFVNYRRGDLATPNSSSRAPILHSNPHRPCNQTAAALLAGMPDQPFWNMLSISPVLYQGNVVFYMVRFPSSVATSRYTPFAGSQS